MPVDKLLLIIVTSFLLAACSTTPKIPVNAEQRSVPRQVAVSTAPTPTIIRVAAVGDVMLGTDYPNDRLPPQDGGQLLAFASPLLQEADIAFANLEGVLLDGGEPRKQCKTPKHCYLFRSPARYAQHLKDAGLDVLSLANNHARDFGEEGRTASMQALALRGLYHSGRLGDVARWQIKGKKVALIAFAPFANANDMLDLDSAHEVVTRLSEQNDIVIVSIHAGAEGDDVMHLPFADEMYHGEFRGDSVAFAHRVIDAGADLVVGHGPHVPRAMELYRGRLIAYSLGNFCTFWGIKISGNNGLAPLLTLQMTGDGQFIQGQIHSFRQFRPQGSLPDPTGTAARLIAELTRQDFPHGQLSIDVGGEIVKVGASRD
jgi:hypothetical protein